MSNTTLPAHSHRQADNEPNHIGLSDPSVLSHVPDTKSSNLANDLTLNSLTSNDLPLNSLTSNDLPLNQYIERVIRQYLAQLEGAKPHNLYDTIIAEVEKPLLTVMLEHNHGNQTKTAKMLGVSRGTLRKKLAQHKLD